jgi:hypothetical protein
MDAADQAQFIQRLQRTVNGDQTQRWAQGTTTLTDLGWTQVPIILLQDPQYSQPGLGKPVSSLSQCLGYLLQTGVSHRFFPY